MGYAWDVVNEAISDKENEYLTGTPDVVLLETVEDNKNSWDQNTFPLFDNEIPIDGYGWQLQGYCALFDKKQGGLFYTLMDMPESMVEKEAYFKAKDLGFDETPLEIYEEVKAYRTYSNLHEELRIKRFFVDADKELIESVYERVEQIREYIKSL